MKEGWTYKKLGEIATYINGFPFKPSDWKETGKPIIRIQNLTNPQGGFNRCSRTDIPEKYHVTKGDVLISWSATLGVFEWESEDALLNQHIFKVVFDKADIDKQFFKYAVLMSIAEMAKHTNGATMKHIRKGDFDNIKIPYPSLSEQQSIVDYLDSAFSKIDAMKANAEKALNEAKAIFQASLKEMLEPKEGWETSTLKDECYKITDGTHQTPKYYPSGYIFLSSKNVTSRKIDWEDVKFIDESQHQIMHKRVAPQVGDILLAKNGTTGVAAMVDRDVVFDIYVSLALLRSRGNVTPEYLLTFVNSPIAKEQFNKRLIGMGVPNLHLGEINQVVITYPQDKAEQLKMTRRIEELDSLIIRLQANHDKISQECDALKQAILRQVFE